MSWRPSARIVRPGGCTTANLRGMALQPLPAWPDSNINGGADYSVDLSSILGCGETVESFEFDPGLSGRVEWISSYGSTVTAFMTWLNSGPITVTVGALTNFGNTLQVTISINVSAVPSLFPSAPGKGPGPLPPTVTDAFMEGWVYLLGATEPERHEWWLNAGIPTFNGQPDAGDPSIPGLIITDQMMTDWASNLPTTAPARGWWLNAGVWTFVGSPQRYPTQINSAQMASWLAGLITQQPNKGWWNNANIPTLLTAS